MSCWRERKMVFNWYRYQTLEVVESVLVSDMKKYRTIPSHDATWMKAPRVFLQRDCTSYPIGEWVFCLSPQCGSHTPFRTSDELHAAQPRRKHECEDLSEVWGISRQVPGLGSPPSFVLTSKKGLKILVTWSYVTAERPQINTVHKPNVNTFR